MKKTDIHLALDRMCESWLQNFSDLESGRITISESRRRSKELNKDMKVIKKAIREEKRSDDPITKAVIHLGKLCGMDNSDSGSEAFVEQLHLCTGRTMGDIDESHAEEGLCLDACRVLADRLKKREGRQLRSIPMRRPRSPRGHGTRQRTSILPPTRR